MPLKKYIQFVATLVLGLVLTLSSYPAQSQQKFPSFDTCFKEVNSYPKNQDLNRYSKRQVYCLFAVELIDGGVQVDKKYYPSELFGVIMNAFRDMGDHKSHVLSYKQITKRFPGDKLNELINKAIDKAVRKSALSQSYPVQVAATRIPLDRSPSSSVLAQWYGLARGGDVVNELSADAGDDEYGDDQ